MQQRSQRLQQLKGVGALTAAILLADMPELGSLRDETAVALAGVAPYNEDSGPKTVRAKSWSLTLNNRWLYA
jgi:transposase